MYENNVILRTNDRPTDLAFWKTSDGHISATGHPIHFMFDCRVGFSGTADRTDLFPVSPNPRWRLAPSWKISNGHISATDHPMNFAFDPRVGFSGTAVEWTYFRLDQVQDGGQPPSCKISNGHISGMSYPIHFHELQLEQRRSYTGENARGVIRLVTI